MAHFDIKIFAHASYVAFVYACLAWGATYYRQSLDNLDAKKIRLGEDLYFALDPLWILTLFLLFAVFVGLWFFIIVALPAEVQYYIVPLAVGVNIVQLSYRMFHQRLQICTGGIIGKSLFQEIFQTIEYDTVFLIEIQHGLAWNLLALHYAAPDNDSKIFQRRISHQTLTKALEFLQSATSAPVIVAEKTKKRFFREE